MRIRARCNFVGTCTRPAGADAGACAFARVMISGAIAVALEAAENKLLSVRMLKLEIGFFIGEIGASFELTRALALAMGTRSKLGFKRR